LDELIENQARWLNCEVKMGKRDWSVKLRRMKWLRQSFRFRVFTQKDTPNSTIPSFQDSGNDKNELKLFREEDDSGRPG
jgi:hypothetical protein